MTENNAAQPRLTDEEILDAIKAGIRAARDEGLAYAGPDNYVVAGALALLSKLRAEGVQAGDERETFEEWDRLFTAYCGAAQGVDAGKAANALVAFTRAALASAPVPQPSAPVASTEQVSGHDRLLRAAATQEAKDGIGAMDALFDLAVKHGASRTAAAGFAHVANGALATLEGQVHDEIRRRSVATRASAPVAGKDDHDAK